MDGGKEAGKKEGRVDETEGEQEGLPNGIDRTVVPSVIGTYDSPAELLDTCTFLSISELPVQPPTFSTRPPLVILTQVGHRPHTG